MTVIFSFRRSNRVALAGLESRPEEPCERYRRVLGVPHRSQPGNQANRVVSQQQAAAALARHHHHEPVAGAAEHLEADTRPVHVSRVERTGLGQQQ